MDSDSLVFVHISDLHFRREDIGSQFDADADIRNEFQRDLLDVVEQTNAVRGVLVSGDIAYGGKEEEYEAARQWLDDLLTQLDCKQTDVWTVPGNHDVDHEHISQVTHFIHDNIRSHQGEALNRKFRTIIEDSESAKILLRPLSGYQDFAGRYECFTTSEQIVWTEELPLNDGSKLCLWGCNSALISGPEDPQIRTPWMVLGLPQYMLPKRRGVAYLVLCHHPCGWLLDQTKAERMLNQRATIQLFGHEHVQYAEKVGESLRLYSGALHPNRNEGQYEPLYNVLSLRVQGENDHRQLEVQVKSRIYRNGTFQEASGGENVYYLDLPNWTPSALSAQDSPNISSASKNFAAIEPGQTTVSPIRHLTYLFYNLPYTKRLEVALKLDLMEDADQALPEADLFPLLLQRAIDQDKVEAMLKAVELARVD